MSFTMFMFGRAVRFDVPIVRTRLFFSLAELSRFVATVGRDQPGVGQLAVVGVRVHLLPGEEVRGGVRVRRVRPQGAGGDDVRARDREGRHDRLTRHRVTQLGQRRGTGGEQLGVEERDAVLDRRTGTHTVVQHDVGDPCVLQGGDALTEPGEADEVLLVQHVAPAERRDRTPDDRDAGALADVHRDIPGPVPGHLGLAGHVAVLQLVHDVLGRLDREQVQGRLRTGGRRERDRLDALTGDTGEGHAALDLGAHEPGQLGPA
jgi:hypothetical protein